MSTTSATSVGKGWPSSPVTKWLKSFLVREDPAYDALVTRYQAKKTAAQIFYLFLHLAPGILAYILINVPSVYGAVLHLTGLPGPILQGCYLIAITVLWHALVPLFTLRWADKLTLRESIAFLGLDRFDGKGFLLVVPVVFIVYTVLSLPFMKYLYPAIGSAINAMPALALPSYSIFQGNKIYALSPGMLVLFAIGNFLGEEIYFRGYLLKKIGFLGPWAWVVNSLLFAFYHSWQPAMTWPLAGFALFFGLLMQWRKNLYPLILFHFLANIAWGIIIGIVLSRWH